MSQRLHQVTISAIVLASLGICVAAVSSGNKRAAFSVRTTAAEVQPVHSPLSVDGKDVRGVLRVGLGSTVETGADGRGRAHLDDGTALVIDRATKFKVTATGLDLAEGRMFVQVPGTVKTKAVLPGVVAIASGSTLAIERRNGKSSVFCASGELTVQDPKGTETRVHSGETATVAGDTVTVKPEAAFDDWTAGMASPWGASGAPKNSIGELWGRMGNVLDGEAGSPLAIRASEVTAEVVEEVAHTQVRTTYFNAGSGTVRGDFRLAVPRGAIVAQFTIERGDSKQTAHLAVADRERTTPVPSDARLEWAGDGWLRGTLPSIAPGATVSVSVGWYEWLSPAGGRIQYRYPLASTGSASRIGEFFFKLDMEKANPTAIVAGAGAEVMGKTVSLRKSDFVATSDIVIEGDLEQKEGVARAYVAPWQTARPGDTRSSDAGGDYVVVRTELPQAKADAGVTLALVVDVSGSIDGSLLDAQRALVEALLQGLGDKDRVVVLAADQSVTPVGPDKVTPVTQESRKAILEALAKLSPGGATDLGRALERGADAIPADAPAGMVVYLGDGWPTVGDTNVDAMEARLARRAGGLPRLGAVAVGSMANRFALSALVRGSGPVLEIRGREDAATAAVALLAEALRPAVADVEITFPPGVERVYPRGAHAQVAGATVQSVGRLVGQAPESVKLHWRDAQGMHEENRRIELRDAENDTEVRRRWAMSRVEELAFRQAGREAATDVAYAEGLLTPWTAWVVGSGGAYVPTPVDTRILDLSGCGDSPYNALLSTPSRAFGALTDSLTEPEEDPKPDTDAYRASVRVAGQRVIDAAGKQIRTCRNARAALRADLSGTLRISVSVGSDGAVKKVTVVAANLADNDPLLDECVRVVVSGLRFPETSLTGTVEFAYLFELPPPPTMVGRKCSPPSLLPLSLRRGIWLERLRAGTAPDLVYLNAKQACELKEWSDKRAMLELILNHVGNGVQRVGVARKLARAGEDDAAALLRREAMRRAQDPQELWAVRLALLGDEKLPVGEFRKQYNATGTDEGRLAVVRKFLLIAPHDSGLRRRLFALLEATGQKEALVQEVAQARQDPLADATLLADGAAAIRRVGYEAEARRAYGELAERAADDPAVRAYLGDRLRAEGWFDEATATYAALEELSPDEPSTLLRLAMAHAGAGRLDVATRMLTRLARTGGRSGDTQAADVATELGAVLVIEAATKPGVPDDMRGLLRRRALEFPWPKAATVVLVRFPRLLHPIEATLMRGPKDGRDRRSPDVSLPALGILAFTLQPGDEKDAELTVRRPRALQPEPKVSVVISVLRGPEDLSEAVVTSLASEGTADGEPVSYLFDGATIQRK